MPTKPSSAAKEWQMANCHCQAIKYRIYVAPIVGREDSQTVMSCNCSMCRKNGYLNVYPVRTEILVRVPSKGSSPQDQPTAHSPKEVHPGSPQLRCGEFIGYYSFGAHDTEHAFCKSCGSSMWVDAKGGALGKKFEGEPDIVACNARMFVDFEPEKVKMEFFNGWNLGPEYVVS